MSVVGRINNTNNNNNHHHHHHSTTAATTTTTTTQACAACKHQRRKCAPDCVLAPYFPHDRHRQFLNCHKLFGVSNITKIIRDLHPPDKDHAMRTIIFQSDVRASDPVGGCYRIIRDLHRQIDYAKAELDLVLHHLSLYRSSHHHSPAPPVSMSIHDPLLSDPLTSYYHHQQQQHHLLLNPSPPPPPPPPLHSNYHILQQQHQHDMNAWVMHDVVDSLHVKDGAAASPAVFLDVDDIKPLLDIHADGDDAGGVVVDVHDLHVHHRSDEVVFEEGEGRGIVKEENDSIRHVQDHDLKGAATLFTLTNCNA